MSLKDVYQRFLSDPRSAPLAPDVSLIYITSTTEFNGAEAVLKHLTKQQHIIKTNSQTVIDAVQGSNALSLDIETALQFVSGGGAYLPNLDETFLLDRVAKFPTVGAGPLPRSKFPAGTNIGDRCYRSISFASIPRIKSRASESTGTRLLF
jgi:hypothetical protein